MTLPYNVYKTGIIPAIIITIIYDLISFYTCKIYVDYGTKDNDFSLTIEKYLESNVFLILISMRKRMMDI